MKNPPMTNAQRQALWRKRHPKTAKQRKFISDTLRPDKTHSISLSKLENEFLEALK